MKILYDPQIFNLQVFGGISLYYKKLLEEFNFNNTDEINFKLPIIYSDNKYLKNFQLINTFSLTEKNFPFKKQYIKLLNSINRNKTVKELNKQDFDIYHPTYFDDYFLNHIKNKPFILTVHDMTNEVVPEYFVFDKRADETIKIKKKLIESANRIIAISENTKKDIMRFCEVDEDKIDVIYHGLPFDSTESQNESNDLPERYVLFIGQRSKYKNFISYLLSISNILQEDDSLYLVTAGGNPFTEEEQNIIHSLNLSKKIIYKQIDSEEALISFYKHALCFVFPSLYEGFGFPILEAFQCDCPLLASNTSSFPEVAGNAAVYIDPYNQESMENGTKKIIYDENLMQELIKNGREQLKIYSWAETARLTKQAYTKALQ
ncbi:MAG: hypothetical protein A2X64_07615 [Ignavibacteria bacterium GWF2_33_9]|nr:MAG: hypothetical protein A2X64_07615 [Ignavibacteria bacterium GWF2_33_9]